MRLLNKIRFLNALLSVIIWANIYPANRALPMQLRVEDDTVQMHFTVADPVPEVVPQQQNVGVQNSFVHESLASRATRFYTMQATQKKYQQEQKEIEHYSQFTQEQFHREIIDYIQHARRAGHSMSRAQELVLGNNHLYCLSTFVDNVKEFPAYRAHVKDMHAKYQSQKGRFYDFRKRHGWIAHDFVKAVEVFEQLNAVIVSEEIRESEISQVQVRQLFSDYKVARPSKGSASVARMRDREQALHKTQVTNYARTAQRYRLSDTALGIVSEHRYDPALFTDFVGTELQHQLQRESVDLVSQAIEMSVRRTGNQSPVPLDMIMHFTVASCELNRNGDVAKGYMVSDFCWALLDYGTAILEGSGQGLKAAVQDMKAHPVQIVASVVAAEGVVAYQLAKLLTEVAQVSIQGTINNVVMAFNPEEGVKRWAAQLEPINKAIDVLCTKEVSVRSGIKEGTKLAVQLTIQSKLLGGLKEFYSGIRTRATAFIRKNPAAMPEQYMATPEGMLFKVASDVPYNKKFKDSTVISTNGVNHAIKVETFIKNGKELVRDVPVAHSSQGIIKTFEVRHQHFTHMFSPKHVDNGIMLLGNNKLDILDACIAITQKSDGAGLLREGSNQIETVLNGLDATVRVDILDGVVRSIDAFKGISARKMGNTFSFFIEK